MCSSLLAYCLILAVFLSQGFIQVSCFGFNFSTFQKEDERQLILSKNSYIVQNAIQVTPDITGGSMENLSGRALYRKSFRLYKGNRTIASFNTTFVLNIQSRTSPGGEGMAFIITGNYSLPENSDEKWLGIVNANSNGSPQAMVVAVEFDTRKSYDEDLDGNHIGLNINSIDSITQVSLGGYGINISGGEDLRVHLQYDGKNLTVFVGDNKTLVLSQPLDLSAYLPEKVFVGFSASTSNQTELNCVKSWAFFGTDIGDRNLLWVWILIPAVVLALITGVLFCLCWRRDPIEQDLEGAPGNIEDEITRSNLAPRKFRLKELKQATGNFSPKYKLGKGGFGTVYKGSWRNKDVAVKRVSKKSHQGKQEFIAELTTIGNLNHKNLVKLIGWCYERRELLLVYEYMPNGSLDKFIFCDDKASMEELTLSWEQRLTIIQGVAQALEYLHNGCQKRVLHRDIKASNIMLDTEFIARLGDFGLARTIQEKEKTHHSTVEIAGTPGYMAPETFLISRATVETDVYSFGVLVLEVVCGRKPGNQSEQNNYNNSIVNWLWEYYRKGRITDAADSRMDGNFIEKEVECVLILGLACCHPNPHCRPSMRTVLQVLSGEADPPELPLERPSFVWPAMPPSFGQMDYSHKGSQLTPFTELTGR
ncbi:probable L-type lectin-domain containing receptor kinase S.5 [Durio zibethinus]|uniref:non-specific serine/threonine protein kinase n=1 Tax=Durio zibethinus TaxID=66656 RepID=A0A6P6APK7_DURZI|nr:probable L-type lectin-domain containing receptor kinase S.5 [Durio zibethinus]